MYAKKASRYWHPFLMCAHFLWHTSYIILVRSDMYVVMSNHRVAPGKCGYLAVCQETCISCTVNVIAGTVCIT